jgi:hypothetical protein
MVYLRGSHLRRNRLEENNGEVDDDDDDDGYDLRKDSVISIKIKI